MDEEPRAPAVLPRAECYSRVTQDFEPEQMTATPKLAPTGASPSPGGDPVLLPFLEARDDESARARLGELLAHEASPLAWQVIRSQLRAPGESDLDDVHAGVLLSLAGHLRMLRHGEGEPIRAFASYVAVIAHNACHALLRARSPQRARLRTRTRYVLTRDPALALWEGRGREWLCGQAAWGGGSEEPGAASRLSEMGRRLGGFADFPDLVRALVRGLPGPARFDDLVDALAAIQGISDRPEQGRDHEDGRDADPLPQASDPAPSPEEALTQRDFLSRLWAEIRLLPARQRVALLLNLRDGDGGGMIGLFPLTGTAQLPDLAQVLEMPEARLQALWGELPRDDEWIADWLGVTRRQVINLRKSARERLARRLRRSGW
jgi:RNA polymerase sigma factor (sigma-70 family)